MKLNKELVAMQDKRDLEIAKLKRTIAAFKKYDNKRKKYLQMLQYELEDVSAEYCALKHSLPNDAQEAMQSVKALYEQRVQKLRDTVRGQNNSIDHLQKAIRLMESPKLLAKAEEILKNYDVVQLQKINEDLQREVQHLHKTNSELVAKLIKFQNNKLNVV